jgi:hypothetical protein
MSLWTRVHAFATHTRREVLTYAITNEAQRRGWTPDQVRQEVEAAGGKREGDVAHRYAQVQPTQDGLEFWHTERQQYGPNYPREMTGEPLPAYKAERREPTAAELWREQYTPGPAGLPGRRPPLGLQLRRQVHLFGPLGPRPGHPPAPVRPVGGDRAEGRRSPRLP